MTLDRTVLQAALSAVERECEVLREERCAFEAFRETFRLTKSDPQNDAKSSPTTRKIREVFQETEKKPFDY